ncbi:hypothetical protein PspCFBP13508_23255 [Pseudomonas sp. CFBP13508]|nr:hypothetical protein PspCFBP13508_23255 [Pseudomonas sp. CFBP13508]
MGASLLAKGPSAALQDLKPYLHSDDLVHHFPVPPRLPGLPVLTIKPEITSTHWSGSGLIAISGTG